MIMPSLFPPSVPSHPTAVARRSVTIMRLSWVFM
jgi:hypothetical protein